MQKRQKLRTQTVKKWGIKFMRLDRVFPSEKYKKYLEEFSVKDEEQLDEKNIEEMFLTLRADFIKGKLDLDEFAQICNALWWLMTKKHFDDDNPALASALHEGDELSFDIRSIPKLYRDVANTLRIIYDYKPKSGSVHHGSSAPSEDFYH